ncbi:MAG: DUF2892 domain-containing protein [bacterium]
MKKNMGTADIIVRIVIALLIGILFFTNVISGTVGIILLVVAAISIITSIFGICPAYLPFGLNTRKKE